MEGGLSGAANWGGRLGDGGDNRHKRSDNWTRANISWPFKQEISGVIQAMKNNMNPSENDITAENLKYGGDL